ncbi:ATP-binding cassette, subfamily B [Micromonospora pallida]|uniref:ATP-binding cassette, subfamily B n=1 Tax=Micromonospora pallida TaxID=145854 RepID=A0A1C6RUI9_9ACTN|nr:ABC transporter ATP-binding protein [Micromonospora pallida]SCL20835.1 ATP-binding cassette, subfamily B [Micromonospora pallida]
MRPPSGDASRPMTTRSTLRDRMLLIGELRHSGPLAVIVLMFTQVTIALVPALTALTIENLVNRVLLGSSLTVALILLGAVLLAGRLAQTVSAPATFLVSQRIDMARRAALTSLAVSGAHLGPMEQPRTRELIRVARADPEFWAERPPGTGATAQLDLIMRWIGVLAATAVLASFAWWLAPLVIIPAVASRWLWRRQFMEHIEIERRGVSAGMEADHWRRLAVDATDGKESRTFGLQHWALARWHERLMTMLSPKWHAGIRSVLDQWQVAVLVGPPLTVAFTLVVWHAGQNGDGVAEAAAVLGAGWAVLNLLGFIDALEIEGAIPGCRAYATLRAETADPYVPVAAVSQSLDAPRVRFEQVSFAYSATGPAVLDGLDLEIAPGELLAVVGLNGAGKSTLIKLLAGLYTPSSGRITVDGVDLAAVEPPLWRSRISIVFQDFVCYHLSCLDNVALGYAAAPVDRKRIEQAAADSGLDQLVARLPLGWDTPLARTRVGGVDLSGGQWQKVVLTRAMYALRCGARLLVLDEPTAHLDVKSEFEVFHELARHKRHAGVVLISHRLSTVRLADRIVLLDGGRIVESGSHDELMAEDGRYAKLFITQAERFNQGFDDRFDEEDTP